MDDQQTLWDHSSQDLQLDATGVPADLLESGIAAVCGGLTDGAGLDDVQSVGAANAMLA